MPAIRGIVAVGSGHNEDGLPNVYAVTAIRNTAGCRPSSFRVQVPERPNGAARWMQAHAVKLFWVDTQIVIHIQAAQLELVRGGYVVLRSPIAPGAPGTPTPTGRFYVTERLVTKNPNGPWGPAALGTSAFSPVLKNWARGGPIGIHGTNEPSVIGHAVSHGCIRLPNRLMQRLFDQVPAGTPVVIRA